MAITQADFNKIWASTSPLTPYEFSENNYKQGWNFVGATPPSRQMWDYLQKQNDEKAQWLYLNVVQGIPIGVVQAFAGNTVPDGWLLCDGSAVSRTTYANLFSVIGTAYGSGDGSTTFNVPNLIDKFVEGSSTAGTIKSAGLPNITGELSKTSSDDWGVDDPYTGSNEVANNAVLSQGAQITMAKGNTVTAHGWNGFTFDASRSNSIYGNSTTVQPPALTMQYIIKY